MELELDKGEDHRTAEEFRKMAQGVDLNREPFLHDLSGAVLTDVYVVE